MPSFETLMTSTTSEIESAGEVAVETGQAEADLEKKEKALAEDVEVSANLAKN